MMMSEAFKMSYDVIAKSDKCNSCEEETIRGKKGGRSGANDREPMFKYIVKNDFY